MFITLLSMGKSTLRQLKKERKHNFEKMKQAGYEFAKMFDCKILETPANTISIAMKLPFSEAKEDDITKLGSILYSKRVMGHRIIVSTAKITKINQFQFKNYGSHNDSYTDLPYITFACAVGMKSSEI